MYVWLAPDTKNEHIIIVVTSRQQNFHLNLFREIKLWRHHTCTSNQQEIKTMNLHCSEHHTTELSFHGSLQIDAQIIKSLTGIILQTYFQCGINIWFHLHPWQASHIIISILKYVQTWKKNPHKNPWYYIINTNNKWKPKLVMITCFYFTCHVLVWHHT